jgi:hypothetical protein
LGVVAGCFCSLTQLKIKMKDRTHGAARVVVLLALLTGALAWVVEGG